MIEERGGQKKTPRSIEGLHYLARTFGLRVENFGLRGGASQTGRLFLDVMDAIQMGASLKSVHSFRHLGLKERRSWIFGPGFGA
jgi:hypothetical protein